ncbi:hypothetical protein [Microbacterium sp. GXF6406]
MSKYNFSLIAIGLLAAIILAAGWFVGMKPQLDRMGEANKQTENARQINDVQAAKNAALAEDHKRLDEYKAQITATQAEIPQTRSQQGLVDQINAAADNADVMMRSLTFDSTIRYTPPTGVTIAPVSSGDLVAVTVSISAEGDRERLEDFAARLQASKRLVTVVDSIYTGPEDAVLTLNGITWVLQPTE